MDFLAPRSLAEGENGFDDWLSGYLLEVIPTATPALPSQSAQYVQEMPQITPVEFLVEPVLDADMMAGLAQDHASSNSGEYSNEHNAGPLGEPTINYRSTSCADEPDKTAQKAARVAEKNRCVHARCALRAAHSYVKNRVAHLSPLSMNHRRAQKRFREREKMKKATLESQVHRVPSDSCLFSCTGKCHPCTPILSSNLCQKKRVNAIL